MWGKYILSHRVLPPGKMKNGFQESSAERKKLNPFRSLLRRANNCSGVHWDQLPIANVVVAVSPANAIAGKAGQPYASGQQIPDREQPQLPINARLLQTPPSNHLHHGDAEGEIRAQINESRLRCGLNRDRRQGSGQTQGKNQAQVSPRTHDAHHHSPAQTLQKKVA